MDGGFPIDLVLFGMVAVFLVLRLTSILGRRTGYERPAEPAVPSNVVPLRRTAPVPEAVEIAVRDLPDPTSPMGLTLAAMAGIDRSFTPQRFLAGAEAAFRIIVVAFAEGARTTLHPLLSMDTYRAFEGAIAAREATGETQHTEIKSVAKAEIEHAELAGTLAVVTVRFVSDQVNITIGADGLPVAGTDAVTEIVDLWSFERELTSTDPAWRLVAARSA